MGKLLKKILLDNNNKELWNVLCHKYSISLSLTLRGSHIKRINTKVKIKMNFFQIKPYILYHELLHLYLWNKEFNMLDCIYSSVEMVNSQIIRELFSSWFIYSVSNACDHAKMYTLFSQSEYANHLFLPKEKISYNKIILNLKDFNWNTYYSIKHIRVYILLFIESSYMQNQRQKDEIFVELNKIDDELFLILQSFLNELLKYDLESKNHLALSPLSSAHFFLTDLDEWLENKIKIDK